MNKKVDNSALKNNNYEEDLEIKKVAYMQNPMQNILLYVLICLFCIMLGASIVFINSYYQKKVESNSLEKIEITTKKSNVIITNLGEIKETITKNSFVNKTDYTIEKINTMEIETKKDSEDNGIIKFNIIYDIYNNDFPRNEYATNDSDVLVRFSYSHDGVHWIYVNNVISTNESTLRPLMGNFYDISGLVTKLKVVTNYELSSTPGEKVEMYWRSETTFKYNKNEKLNSNYKANFKIEYKSND